MFSASGPGTPSRRGRRQGRRQALGPARLTPPTPPASVSLPPLPAGGALNNGQAARLRLSACAWPPGLSSAVVAASGPLGQFGQGLLVVRDVARLRDRVDDLPAHDAFLVDDKGAP